SLTVQTCPTAAQRAGIPIENVGHPTENALTGRLPALYWGAEGDSRRAGRRSGGGRSGEDGGSVNQGEDREGVEVMRTMRLLGVLGVSGLMALLSALAGTGRVEAAGGNTYFVSPTGTATTCVSGNTFNTIGAALSCANQDGTTVSSPDTIIIAAGTYNEHSLDVQADVTMTGTAGSTTIDAQQQGRVMTVQSRDPAFVVSISGLTLKDGLTPTCTEPPGPCPEVVDGGGIINFGTLSITNSTLSGNTASSCRSCVARGGGIFNAGTLSLTNSTLRGNTACGNNLICNG